MLHPLELAPGSARPSIRRIEVLAQERQQHLRRRAAGEGSERVVLVQVSVIAHRLDDDPPAVEMPRQLADGGALHLDAERPADDPLQPPEELGVLVHGLAGGDGADDDLELRPSAGSPSG